MNEFSPQEDYVVNTVNNRDVHFLRLWFTDVLGNLKSFAINPNELERAFAIGMPLAGGCIAGLNEDKEVDVIACPQASSFQILPWRPSENSVARMFCDIKTPDGEPFKFDTRHVLQRVLEEVSKKGYLVNVKPNLEFYYFTDEHNPLPLDEGSSFDLTSLDNATDLRRDTILTLEGMGIPVEKSYHEKGSSQHQIDLRTTDAMSMADAMMTYKLVVKEIAEQHEVFATFMPKPLNGQPGNSMHLIIHLVDENGENAFFDPKSKDGTNLTKIAKQFIAGILKYAKETCLLTNQYENSYKRLMAPECTNNHIAWSKTSKSTMVRLQGHRPTTEESSRVEIKNPDPAANPYLALAALIKAGLAGIEEKLELPQAIENRDEIEEKSERLPETLGEAIHEFEQSKLMKETLGEELFNYIVKIKKQDWKKLISHVHQCEIDELMAVL